jgi:hypothetical protein
LWIVKVRFEKLGLPAIAAMRGVRDVLYQRIDNGAERRPDDNGDGEIHHVAPENELFELLDHALLFSRHDFRSSPA